jgi:L-threonylcarbamoyladenylate synthase
LIFAMQILPANPDTWRLAAQFLRGGQLVVFPTDTVYGIGCDARNPEAISGIYAAKGRSTLKAIPLLLSGDDVLREVAATVSPGAEALARRYWPGALTVVVNRRPVLPKELGGGETIAVRVPNHEELRTFIRACGGFIGATSAKHCVQPDAHDAAAAAAYFGDIVSLIVDGGPVSGGIPSTVVNCAVEPPVLVREGAIPAGDIHEVLDGAND